MSEQKPFTADDFRKELKKLLPGYKWTVHNGDRRDRLEATGTISSGFNRTSTMEVMRREDGWYDVRSAGYGKRAPWLGSVDGKTLARAVRSLQDYYERMEREYGSHARAIEGARKVDAEDVT